MARETRHRGGNTVGFFPCMKEVKQAPIHEATEHGTSTRFGNTITLSSQHHYNYILARLHVCITAPEYCSNDCTFYN